MSTSEERAAQRVKPTIKLRADMHRIVRTAVFAVALLSAGCGGEHKPSAIVMAPSAVPEAAVGGAIGAKYQELGGRDGILGAPKGPEQDGPDGGKWQDFDGGTIMWTAATGAHHIWGDVLQAWKGHGGAIGKLGYPTTDEKDAANGGKEVHFLGGVITWIGGKSIVVTH